MEGVCSDNIRDISEFLECTDLLNFSLCSRRVNIICKPILIPSRYIYKFELISMMIEDECLGEVIDSFMSHDDEVFQRYLSDNHERLIMTSNNIYLIHLFEQKFQIKFYGDMYSDAHLRYLMIYHREFHHYDDDYDVHPMLLYHNEELALMYHDTSFICTSVLIAQIIENESLYLIDEIVRQINDYTHNPLLMMFLIEISIERNLFYNEEANNVTTLKQIKNIPLHHYLVRRILPIYCSFCESHRYYLRYVLGTIHNYKIDICDEKLEKLIMIDQMYCKGSIISVPKDGYEKFIKMNFNYISNDEDIDILMILIVNDVYKDFDTRQILSKSLGIKFKDVLYRTRLAIMRYINSIM